jgi:hypothetical protein
VVTIACAALFGDYAGVADFGHLRRSQRWSSYNYVQSAASDLIVVLSFLES